MELDASVGYRIDTPSRLTSSFFVERAEFILGCSKAADSIVNDLWVFTSNSYYNGIESESVTI